MSRLPGHAVEVAIPELRAEARLRDLDNRITSLEGLNLGGTPPDNAIFLAEANGAYGGSTAAQTLWVTEQGGAVASGTLTTQYPVLLKWEPTEWARPGRNIKWWMHGYLYTNSGTFGTITFSLGMRRFTVGGTTGGISYTMLSPDTEAKAISFVNPTGGLSTPAPAISDAPAAGNYAAYETSSATTATNAYIMMKMRLYVFWE